MATVLNTSQVLILQTLAKADAGLSTDDLATKSGASVSPENLGPVYKETLVEGNGKYAESLYGLGMVAPKKEDDGPVLWHLTAKGVKAAATLKARKRTSERVPPRKLDPVVRKFRATRVYGFESYTDADMTEIRTALGDEFAKVSLDDLRQQLANRRKQGAFADPAEKIAKAVERAIREFGPDGTIKAMFTAAQCADLRKFATPKSK